MSRVAFAAVLFALLLTAAPAFADGALHPIACASLDSPPPSGCSHDDALGLPYGIQVSADGRNAYGLSRGELEIYDRAADGTLRRKSGDAGCFAAPGNGLGCKIAPVFGDGYSLGISPAGHHLYAADYQAGAVLTFTRASDGALSFPQRMESGTTDLVGCPHGVRGLGSPLWVSVDPADGTVYVAGTGSIASFVPQRD